MRIESALVAVMLVASQATGPTMALAATSPVTTRPAERIGVSLPIGLANPVLRDPLCPPPPARKAGRPNANRHSRGPTPPADLSFDGPSAEDSCDLNGVVFTPAGLTGDLGAGHWISAINRVYEVFDRTGTSLSGPLPTSSLWSGFGGPCETDNLGEPGVVYDQKADRWLLTELAEDGVESHLCAALSTSGDPLLSYCLYDFPLGLAVTLPRIGMGGTEAYSLSANLGSQPGSGALAAALEREPMLSCLPAQIALAPILPLPGETGPYGIHPAHLEGTVPEPAAPLTFVMAWDDDVFGTGAQPDGYRLWELKPDWGGGEPVLTALPPIPASGEFDSELAGFAPSIPQLDSEQRLRAYSELTSSAQARHRDGFVSLLVSHTIDVGSERAGLRWSELRKGTAGWSLHADGEIAFDDGLHRWLSSIAVDGDGVVCLTYSASSEAIHPSLWWTCDDGDPPAFPDSSACCPPGDDNGSETNSDGDWSPSSAMATDPLEVPGFWGTGLYQVANGTEIYRSKVFTWSWPATRYIDPPIPGPREGEWTVSLRGATPNGSVALVADLRPGVLKLPEPCPDAQLQIERPTLVVRQTADAEGASDFVLTVPPQASGRTVIFQAIDLDTCSETNIVTFEFP